MSVAYSIDFHIPIKELPGRGLYVVESETARGLLEILAQRFTSIQTLMSFGGGKRPPVAMLAGGRLLDMDSIVPDGAEVKIIGAVAGG